jgi:hypothetical protein
MKLIYPDARRDEDVVDNYHGHKVNIQGYWKRSIHFQKFILQKLRTLNPCLLCGWKGNLWEFWYWWSEAAHHWGCGFCYLWHAAMSVGRAILLIWHLPCHMWGSWVLVRCENNWEFSLQSIYSTSPYVQ